MFSSSKHTSLAAHELLFVFERKTLALQKRSGVYAHLLCCLRRAVRAVYLALEVPIDVAAAAFHGIVFVCLFQ